MKKYFQAFVVLIMLLSFNNSNAQVSAYTFAQSSSAYSAISGGTVLVTGTSSTDSWVSAAVTIPSLPLIVRPIPPPMLLQMVS
ncbi:MAG: hypothetical protein IPG89_03795 [Bacteroidetes bacterium]|nr:hypothetical protein [Bacteroidota bacterium]